MLRLLAPVLGSLLALFIASVGNGFISSLTSLRLDRAGASGTMIGLVSAAYFFGIALGALFGDRLISRVGHVRAYSCFASLSAATFLLQGLFPDPWAWLLFRLANGWAIAGVFLIVESWLLMASDAGTRGRLLAIYLIALYGSGVLAQIQLGALDGWSDAAPFMLAGILSSLSVLPMTILPKASPPVRRVKPMSLVPLLRIAPSGVIACFVSGIAIAAVYALLPVYLQRIGMNVSHVGQSMAAVILGAMLLQYPVGRWSDRRDRQTVLIALGLACVALSLLVLVFSGLRPVLTVLLFLLGGGIFAVYPVAVSHSADRAGASENMVQMIQGLLLVNSVGSAISPLLVAPAMVEAGPGGFFWCMLVINAAMAGFIFLRHRTRPAPAPVTPFEPSAQMSPIGAGIRVTEGLVQAKKEQHEGASTPPPHE